MNNNRIYLIIAVLFSIYNYYTHFMFKTRDIMNIYNYQNKIIVEFKPQSNPLVEIYIIGGNITSQYGIDCNPNFHTNKNLTILEKQFYEFEIMDNMTQNLFYIKAKNNKKIQAHEIIIQNGKITYNGPRPCDSCNYLNIFLFNIMSPITIYIIFKIFDPIGLILQPALNQLYNNKIKIN